MLDSFEGTYLDYLHTYLLTCTTCSFFMIDISPGTHAAACTHIFSFLLWRNRQKMLLFLMFLSFTMGRDYLLNLHQMRKQKKNSIFTSFHEFYNYRISSYSCRGNYSFLNSSTLISLISVEVGINVEGVQKLPNH